MKILLKINTAIMHRKCPSDNRDISPDSQTFLLVGSSFMAHLFTVVKLPDCITIQTKCFHKDILEIWSDSPKLCLPYFLCPSSNCIKKEGNQKSTPIFYKYLPVFSPRAYSEKIIADPRQRTSGFCLFT